MNTSLPVLLKNPKAKYVVGADVSTNHRGDEILTFCVVEQLPEDKFIFITQQGQVLSNKRGDWKNQVKALSEFFNTETLIEKR